MSKIQISESAGLIIAILIIAANVGAFFWGRSTVKLPEPGQIQVDTVVVVHTDTIFIEKPVYVDRIKVRTEYVPVTDTIRIHDTLAVEVPIEQLVYRDTSYTAWVSGYHPALDSIQILQKTRVVEVTRTISEKPKRWGLGLYAGVGGTFAKEQSVVGSEAGLLLRYQSTKRWGFDLLGGYSATFTSGQFVPSPHVRVKVSYDLITW